MSIEEKAPPLIEVRAVDLPLHCPNPKMPLWSSHPRVFIDIEHGPAACPYCGTRYALRPGEVIKEQH
jgi:uncharacterized Zn-finger protein